MASIPYRAGALGEVAIKVASGAGTPADPYVIAVGADGAAAVLPAGTNTIGATRDAGPSQTLTRTFTTSADMTTAAAITPAPAAGQRIYALDILVSVAAAMNVQILMETSNNVLARLDFPGAGAAQVTLRGILMGDADAKKMFGKASTAGQVSFTMITFSAVAT